MPRRRGLHRDPATDGAAAALNAASARAVVEATFRREHGRIIAALIRLCGSFDRAEEAMQDAFASALAHWTEQGIPDNPGAWITAASHRKLMEVVESESVEVGRVPATSFARFQVPALALHASA